MPKPTDQEILDDLKAVRERGAQVGTICAKCGQLWKLGQRIEIYGTGPLLGKVEHNDPRDCEEPKGRVG